MERENQRPKMMINKTHKKDSKDEGGEEPVHWPEGDQATSKPNHAQNSGCWDHPGSGYVPGEGVSCDVGEVDDEVKTDQNIDHKTNHSQVEGQPIPQHKLTQFPTYTTIPHLFTLSSSKATFKKSV